MADNLNFQKAVELIEKAVAIKEKVGHPLLKEQRAHLEDLRKKLK